MWKSMYFCGALGVFIFIFTAAAQVIPRLPAPKIGLVSLAQSTTGVDASGQPYYETTLKVTNWKSLDPLLFDRAPELPACGENTNASRTWVTVLGNEPAKPGLIKEISSYCSLYNPDDLQKIAFNVERNKIPLCVLLRFNDRKTGKSFVSNGVEPATGKTCVLVGGATTTVKPIK